jgi:hypothetical protein
VKEANYDVRNCLEGLPGLIKLPGLRPVFKAQLDSTHYEIPPFRVISSQRFLLMAGIMLFHKQSNNNPYSEGLIDHRGRVAFQILGTRYKSRVGGWFARY